MEPQSPTTPGSSEAATEPAPLMPPLPPPPLVPPPLVPPLTAAAPAPSAWMAPSAPASGPPSAWAVAPAVSGRGPVTGLAKLGALVLVLGGLFWSIIGALLLLAGGVARQVLDQVDVQGLGDVRLADVAGGLIAGFGIVILVVALLELFTGIFAWKGSGVARVLGILYGLGFGSLTLLAAGSPSAQDAAAGTGATAIPLVVGIAYLYTALLFIIRWRRSA